MKKNFWDWDDYCLYSAKVFSSPFNFLPISPIYCGKVGAADSVEKAKLFCSTVASYFLVARENNRSGSVTNMCLTLHDTY